MAHLPASHPNYPESQGRAGIDHLYLLPLVADTARSRHRNRGGDTDRFCHPQEVQDKHCNCFHPLPVMRQWQANKISPVAELQRSSCSNPFSPNSKLNCQSSKFSFSIPWYIAELKLHKAHRWRGHAIACPSIPHRTPAGAKCLCHGARQERSVLR